EWKPYALFGGVTVVFVSPKQNRAKMFLKESKKSQQLSMPVWGMDELLECLEGRLPRNLAVAHVANAFANERVGEKYG
ncbi:unnamed protein product, partial [Ectocarpus sp. 12 AP-2014]